MESQGGLNIARYVIYYVMDGIEIENEDILLKKSNRYLSEQLRGEVMTFAQRFEQKGLQRGIEQGVQQMAKKLLSKGLSYDFVSDLTGFPIVELKKLQNS